MDFHQLIFISVAISLLGMVFFYFYYAVRLKRFEPSESEDRVFRCQQCANLYTDDGDVDLSRCPKCGNYNPPFHF